MSLLKTNAVQIGQSATATQNFTLSVPSSPDGTIKLARGNNGATTQDILTVDSSGFVSIPQLPNQSFKNKVINGAMRIDQRNNGGAQTITAGNFYTYCVDRFFAYCAGDNVTGQRLTSTTGTNLCFYRFVGGASTTAIEFGTRLEASEIQDLSGSTATMSVNLSSSSLTQVNWAAYYPLTTIDTYGSRSAPTKIQFASGVFNITSTNALYTAQLSIPIANRGIEIIFSVGALNNSNNWIITNLQLEAGPVASPFERRPITTELNLCRRYYFAASSPGITNSIASQANVAAFSFPWPVQMRASPTLTGSGSISATKDGGYMTVSVGTGYAGTINTASAEL